MATVGVAVASDVCALEFSCSHDSRGVYVAIGFVLGLCVAALAYFVHGRPLGGDCSQTEQCRQTRDVSVQGPVSYARHRENPRFVPLGENSWGAW